MMAEDWVATDATRRTSVHNRQAPASTASTTSSQLQTAASSRTATSAGRHGHFATHTGGVALRTTLDLDDTGEFGDV
ncbi:hypothetical protein GN958_ATG09317 [Phytophthora infestans]|uniref:Uncharacterized protein n=1 Tax=Phytophthora infestans TaxID=4787 RepID=A0A8S9UPY8_PHYIN|nr:hypothetical protein GN958_ATG09317 [Phytophthora infestans]